MIYYITSEDGKLIDSISEDWEALKYKFPGEMICRTEQPITSIYVK